MRLSRLVTKERIESTIMATLELGGFMEYYEMDESEQLALTDALADDVYNLLSEMDSEEDMGTLHEEDE